MKNIFLTALLCGILTAAFAQDSLRYQYAALSLHRASFRMYIYYDTGGDTLLEPSVPMASEEQQYTAALFKGIHYLNAHGYDMVSGDRDYYIFRRRRQ